MKKNMNLRIPLTASILMILISSLIAFGQGNTGKTEILWDFRDTSGDDAKPQEFMKPENDLVMKYLFGNKPIENFEITTRVTGSFTKPNVKETLYYVGGCDDGDGFKASSNCSHASSWNAGWIAIYDGKKPIRKIEAALGYKIGSVTDVNRDGKAEILSFSGYSGMGETTVRGELGQITASGYEKIFPLDEKLYFGSFQLITFAENNGEKDKCYALASVVSSAPTISGKFPTFTEEYFKSDSCDSNWRKITKEQLEFMTVTNCDAKIQDMPDGCVGFRLVKESAIHPIEENLSSEMNYLITPNSAGDIRVGMKISEVRKILKDAVFIRTEDEGVDAIEVKQANKTLMYFFVKKGDEDYESPIDGNTRILRIDVKDSRYQTANGVYCGMKVSEVEQKYGKLKEIVLYELDESEHPTFSDQPKSYDFTATPPGGFRENARVGIYRKDEYTADKYVPNAIISTISIEQVESGSSNNQLTYLIGNDSVGGIRLGMTVAEARNAVSDLNFSRTRDGDGVALISVKQGDVELMTLYANEDDPDAQINEKARIENIEVWDSRFKTAEGVHTQMKLSEAEKSFGKVKKIMLSEIEAREFADFINQPKGLSFRLEAPNTNAGIYVKGQRETVRYSPNAAILSITVFVEQN